jgi:hypothetical protein
VGGKGKSGPVATNDQMVQMQQKQAAQAAQANQQRNARLAYGAQNIRQTFEGRPSDATLLDLSSLTNPAAARSILTPAAAPAANTALVARHFGAAPAAAAAPAPTIGGTLSGGYSWKQLPDDGSNTTQYGIFDSGGNLVDSAGSLSDLATAKIYTGGGGPGSTTVGGFGPDFYNKYNKSILDYYLPQEGQQYNEARTNLEASLARAGTSNSSIAGYNIGKLANQDAINRAQIASGADTQTAALRSTIQQNEQTALNQLYSTEDPSVAANTAQNMVANAELTKPLLNPAGALFTPITVGVGNALTGFVNPTAYINPSAGGVGSTSTTTPSGSQSQGQTVIT